MKETKNSYWAIGFLILCAIALAVVPALMIWHWEMMSLSEPTVLLGLIASWIAALVILGGCGWYLRHMRARQRSAAPVPSAAES